MIRIQLCVWTALLGAVGISALGQEKRASDIQGDVRSAGLRYYIGTVLGDAAEYMKVARMPLSVIRDGAITSRDEKETRKLLAGIAERIQKANLSDDDRKRMASNMVAVVDDAAIEFTGANTASLTFLLRHSEKEGDHLITLILFRTGGKWQVIQEITDSAAVSASK